MTRDLKFRIWDTIDKKWIAPRGNDNAYQTEFLIDINGNVMERYYNSLNKVPNVIIQQYTGCKDSDGKEIYEGDIVVFFNSNYLVEWSNTLYCWRGVHPDYHKGYNPKTFNQYRRYTIEEFNLLERFGKVIGNLMEKPELLKQHAN